MFYKIYALYDKGVEIMLPSSLKRLDTYAPPQYCWFSDDHRMIVSVARGSRGWGQKALSVRLNEYYKDFHRNIKRFACSHISQREINGHVYGEMQYFSSMTGYSFLNRFLLGNYEERELIVTVQSTGGDPEEIRHICDNIMDSLKLPGQKRERKGDDGHAC